MFGASIQNQADDRKRFENNEGDKGSTTLDQIESFKSYGAFALASYNGENYSIQSGQIGNNAKDFLPKEPAKCRVEF